jgi:hypothetical protein
MAVLSTGNPCGVLGADRRTESQTAHDAKDVNRRLRAIGPVADVLGNRFFTAVDGRPKSQLRHVLPLWREMS